jgi:hypothetical protein
MLGHFEVWGHLSFWLIRYEISIDLALVFQSTCRCLDGLHVSLRWRATLIELMLHLTILAIIWDT